MDAALGWIGEIVAWLGSWIPQVIHVRINEKAIKFVGAKAKLVEPGIHLYWPIMTQVEIHPVVRQVMELPTQTVVCTGATAVCVGGHVTFSIIDLHTFLVENWEAEDSMVEAAQAGIRKAVLAESLETINRGRADIDNRLTREVQKAVAAFGVEVEQVRLTTFAPTTVISLLSDGSIGGSDE